MKRLATTLVRLLLAPKLDFVIRAACAFAMAGLIVMVLLVALPIPLLLVMGMGAAHVFGILGIILFAVVVLREAFHAEARQKELQELVDRSGTLRAAEKPSESGPVAR